MEGNCHQLREFAGYQATSLKNTQERQAPLSGLWDAIENLFQLVNYNGYLAKIPGLVKDISFPLASMLKDLLLHC